MATRAESISLSLLGSEDEEEEIVFLHAEPLPNQAATNTIESLLRPRPYLMDRPIRSATPTQRDAARRNERRRPPQPQPHSQPPSALAASQSRISDYLDTNSLILPGHQPPPPPTPAVIDLTEEPDSPVQTRPSLPMSRNPRRTSSQRASPPRLARSDGSTFIAPSVVTHIDLTEDSPEDERPPDHRRLRQQPPRNAFNRFPNTLPDELISFEIMNATAGLARGFGRHLAGLFGVDMVRSSNFAAPQLNVSLNSFQTASNDGDGSKPPMEAVPPPRKDFTRDTCANPDENSVESVVICPACSEELAYDPTGAASQGPVTTGKKRKRAPGEHHFWALKKCGHVYCADCFENRRPTKGSPDVGFRLLSGEAPITAPNDVRCAVDDCETKVSQKSEWVGIFL